VIGEGRIPADFAGGDVELQPAFGYDLADKRRAFGEGSDKREEVGAEFANRRAVSGPDQVDQEDVVLGQGLADTPGGIGDRTGVLNMLEDVVFRGFRNPVRFGQGFTKL